jgi:hypothetical protein
MQRKIIKPRKKFYIVCPDYLARSYRPGTINLLRNVLGSNLYRIINNNDINKFCFSSVSPRKLWV